MRTQVDEPQDWRRDHARAAHTGGACSVRRVDTHTAFVDMDQPETEILGRMMSATGATSEANLLRIALWSLADHLDIGMPNGVFDLRQWGGHVSTQPKKPKTVRVRNPRIRQHVAPAKTHPWRKTWPESAKP